MSFNPNELVLEKIRAVEEYDPTTSELMGRYTQIEEPSLSFSSESTQVTDAMGSPIMTFYRAKSGTFSFTNSLFSLDLAASQFGAAKEIADTDNKLTVPVSEVLPIVDNKVVLKYTPVDTAGAEVKYVKIINSDNTFGKTYEVSATAGDGKFTIDAAARTITLPEGTTGRVFVNYEKETDAAVKIVNNANDSEPEVKTLLIHAIFHDPCNKNLVYAGVIRCARAQINPESVELSLKPDGKHGASYVLQKEFCAEANDTLCEIFVSQD